MAAAGGRAAGPEGCARAWPLGVGARGSLRSRDATRSGAGSACGIGLPPATLHRGAPGAPLGRAPSAGPARTAACRPGQHRPLRGRRPGRASGSQVLARPGGAAGSPCPARSGRSRRRARAGGLVRPLRFPLFSGAAPATGCVGNSLSAASLSPGLQPGRGARAAALCCHLVSGCGAAAGRAWAAALCCHLVASCRAAARRSGADVPPTLLQAGQVLRPGAFAEVRVPPHRGA